MIDINMERILEIAEEAGNLILEVYSSEFSVEYKEDSSPLTLADKRANEFITGALKTLYPDIPQIAEESVKIPYEKRKNWEYVWLIDPLDGTKEFINRNGEFTINIGLIQYGKPVLGVIYAPVKDLFYYSIKDKGAFKKEGSRIQRLPIYEKEKNVLKIIASRSHYTQKTKDFVEHLKEEFGNIDIVNIGSALKLCLIAEGSADIYPRFAPTMEWDTAAGHAIVDESGGVLLEYPSLIPLTYNKESLINPWFIAKRGGVL